MSTEQSLVKQRDALYKPFQLREHEIREGYSTKKQTRWFVYVRREAIQQRLDEVFPLAASIGFCNPTEPYRIGNTMIECAMYIEINGVRREFNGEQMGTGEHAFKGAATDALKRVASLWGMGLYLQSSPTLMTPRYKDDNGNIDWDKKEQYENQAKRDFAAWYKQNFQEGN